MAKFIPLQNQSWTYALDECEDYLLLDSFDFTLKSGCASQEKMLKALEFYHLEKGGTLNDSTLLALNAFLARNGRPILAFVNGHTSNYARLGGADKVLRRLEILEVLRGLESPQRAALIAAKRAEANSLPARDPNITNHAPPPIGGLSRGELERRRAALEMAQSEDQERATIGRLLAELASLRRRIDVLEHRL